MTGVARVGRVIGISWAAVALVISISAFPEVNSDARGIVVAATALSVVAAVTASVALSHGRLVLGGVGLAVSSVAPTFAAAALNLVPLGFGVVLVVTAAKARRTRTVIAA